MNKASATGNTCTVIKDSSNATGIRAEEPNGNKHPRIFRGTDFYCDLFAAKDSFLRILLSRFLRVSCSSKNRTRLNSNTKICLHRGVRTEWVFPYLCVKFGAKNFASISLSCSWFGSQCFISYVRGCEEWVQPTNQSRFKKRNLF